MIKEEREHTDHELLCVCVQKRAGIYDLLYNKKQRFKIHFQSPRVLECQISLYLPFLCYHFTHDKIIYINVNIRNTQINFKHTPF